MKVIRDHLTNDDIKNDYLKVCSQPDLKKQKSGFKFPKVTRSEDSSVRIRRYFNTKQYISGNTTEFKRRVADYFVSKVFHTNKNVLINYSPFKHLEAQIKKNPNKKDLLSVLVSQHLAGTIANRRAQWINTFFFKFHMIGVLANELLSRETVAHENNKKDALLGMRCHK